MFIDLAVNDYSLSGVRSVLDAIYTFKHLRTGAGYLTLDRNRLHTVRLKSGIEFGCVVSIDKNRDDIQTPPEGALRLWLDDRDNYHAIDGGKKKDVGRFLYHIMPEKQLLKFASNVHYGQVYYLYDYDLYLVGIEPITAGKEAGENV